VDKTLAVFHKTGIKVIRMWGFYDGPSEYKGGTYIKCWEYGGNICWPGGRKDKKLYDGFKNYIH
jgi:hypothetical protein